MVVDVASRQQPAPAFKEGQFHLVHQDVLDFLAEQLAAEQQQSSATAKHQVRKSLLTDDRTTAVLEYLPDDLGAELRQFLSAHAISAAHAGRLAALYRRLAESLLRTLTAHQDLAVGQK